MKSATMAERDSLQAADKASTKAKLGAITRELHDALRALGAAPELQRVIREIPDTRSRLAYVGEMTEKAAHRVLNLVDEAMPKLALHSQQACLFADRIEQKAALQSLDADEAIGLMKQSGAFARESVDFAAQQKRILSDIMLTQDFQDLSGQVIKKVIDMITRTESQLVQLLIDEGDLKIADPPADESLQGPQTPDNALAQDDVDDLLASMGF
jgi:chemotaxis protein CheZ